MRNPRRNPLSSYLDPSVNSQCFAPTCHHFALTVMQQAIIYHCLPCIKCEGFSYSQLKLFGDFRPSVTFKKKIFPFVLKTKNVNPSLELFRKYWTRFFSSLYALQQFPFTWCFRLVKCLLGLLILCFWACGLHVLSACSSRFWGVSLLGLLLSSGHIDCISFGLINSISLRGVDWMSCWMNVLCIVACYCWLVFF